MNLNRKPTDRTSPNLDDSPTQDVVARADLVSTMPHAERAEVVVAQFGSDRVAGLQGAEAERRLEEYGPNRL